MLNHKNYAPYSKGKIVIVDQQKAKIIAEHGDMISIVFQEGGKYQGGIKDISKSDAESLHLKKINRQS